MNWEEKLSKFLDDFAYKDDVVGVLVCGSYITGNPSNHSDLDVHIILRDDVDYRERGNKIVDGLLIEYFSNPAKQVREYFKNDYKRFRTMSFVQFITGKIFLDKTGIVKELKEEAKTYFDKHFSDLDSSIDALSIYGMWDMLDDLKDGFENNKEDFDLIYYCNLDKLLTLYMKFIKYPYNTKSILGNITSEIVRKKYLLDELPDKEISELIKNCIILPSREERMNNYEKLTNKILDLCGGFDIDNFKYKSPVDIS